MKTGGIALAAVMLLSVPAHDAAAQDAVRVLVSNGLKAAMEELQPLCEHAMGHRLAMEFNSTAGLKAKIEAGARFDATLITTEAISDLIKHGKPKIVLATGSGPATQSVAAGDAELVLTLASETAPVPGVEVLGPLPGALAYDIHFAGAASSATPNGESVKVLLSFLKGPQAAALFRAKGLEASSPGK